MQKLLPLYLSLFSLSALFGQSSKLVGFSKTGALDSEQSGGMIWQMNPDGSDFQVLKSFQTLNAFQPMGAMLFAPDGKGYVLSHGYNNDEATYLLLRYDPTDKHWETLKNFGPAKRMELHLLGKDGLLYGTREISYGNNAVFSMDTQGENLVDLDLFPGLFSNTKSMLQTPEGKLVFSFYNTANQWVIRSGESGGNWNDLKVFDDSYFQLNDLVLHSDGKLYGGISTSNDKFRIFSIEPESQAFSFIFESSAAYMGNYSSLAWDKTGNLILLLDKSGVKFIQILLNTNSFLNVYEDSGSGPVSSRWVQLPTGELFCLALKTFDNTPVGIAALYKWNGNNNVQKTAATFSKTSTNNRLVTPMVFDPKSQKLYFLRTKESEQEAECWSAPVATAALHLESTTAVATGDDHGAEVLALINGSDHKYYGMNGKGGPNGAGCIFSMRPDGSEFQALNFFTATPNAQGITDGYQALTFFEGSDGMLYGSKDDGRIFRINKDGSGFETIYTQLEPKCNFIEMPDGMLYIAGSDLIRISKDGTQKSVVLSDLISPDTHLDYCTLVRLPDGALSGVGSYTESICLEDYTTIFGFRFELNTGKLKQLTLNNFYSFRPLLGSDGNLFLNGETFDPVGMTKDVFDINCATGLGTFPDGQASNGTIFGTVDRGDLSIGPWTPAVWKMNGDCLMYINWKERMGYKGRFAFETQKTLGDAEPTETAPGFGLMPNPTSSGAQLRFESPADAKAQWSLSDALGRPVYQQTLLLQTGENTIEIPSEVLKTKGVYHVTLRTESGSFTEALVVF